jgi:spore germination cell wall hydrolase CwlJ-like protein
MKLVPGFEEWSELDILTGTIVGEARGEPTEGKIWVGLTVLTRVQNPGWWGRNIREVCLADRQFTCWQDHNKDDIVLEKEQNTDDWKRCRAIASDILLGHTMNISAHPTHYHKANISPKWASRFIKLAQIGNHVFYHDPTIDVRKV